MFVCFVMFMFLNIHVSVLMLQKRIGTLNDTSLGMYMFDGDSLMVMMEY